MIYHLKDYHIKHNVLYLLTYADTLAVEYFRKQGFSKTISLDPEIYSCYIKNYEDAELMECRLDPKINYLELSSVLKVQKEIIKFLIQKERDSDHIRQGVQQSPIENISRVDGRLHTDITWVFKNCCAYHQNDTTNYNCACFLEKFYLDKMRRCRRSIKYSLVRKLKESANDDLYDPKQLNVALKANNMNSKVQMKSLSANISEVKEEYHNASIEKKLEKLGLYSLCQTENCSCKGWRLPETYNYKEDEADWQAPCKVCSHTLECHTSHLNKCSTSAIDNLLNIVVDLECICSLIEQKKGDETTLHVYHIVCKILRRSLHQITKPDFCATFGHPPFEPFSLAQAMLSFTLYKFSNLKSKSDFQFKCKCAQILLNFFDSFKMLNVTSFKDYFPEGDSATYRIDYARWMCFCVLPKYFESLQYHNFIEAFGLSVLRPIYPYFKSVIDKKISSKKMDAKTSKEVSRIFEMFSFELKNNKCPIWLAVDPPLKSHLVPLEIFPKSYQAIFYGQAVKDDQPTKRKMVKSSAFLHCALPSAGPDLPDGVPEEVVIEAMHILKDPGLMHGPRDIWDDFPRDTKLQELQKERNLEIHFVANSATHNVSQKCKMYLIGLQNLFFHLLPNMPKHYITRLIFDTKHRSLALVQNDDVIGGICFRMFPEQDFSEIVFCGVSVSKRVQGYGTLMMNHLKDYHIKYNVLHFLTYVDNYAVEYFQKQGFSKTISLKPEIYSCFIKEYDGSELMECRLDPKINYVDLSNVLKVQKEIIRFLMLKERDSDPLMKPGINYFSQAVQQIPIENISGINSCLEKDRKDEKDSGAFQQILETKLQHILDQVSTHTCSWPFQTLAKKSHFPDYYDVVKKPIDLAIIKDKLDRHFYNTAGRFHDDISLMFKNCRAYHRKDTTSYKCACILEMFYLEKMKESLLLTM